MNLDQFKEGKLLATVDAKEYRLVSLVLERVPSGSFTIFCTAAEWPTTPVALLAQRDEEIARLRARIAELEHAPTVPVENEDAQPEDVRNGEVYVCEEPGCEKRFDDPRRLGTHRWYAHRIPGSSVVAMRHRKRDKRA